MQKHDLANEIEYETQDFVRYQTLRNKLSDAIEFTRDSHRLCNEGL